MYSLFPKKYQFLDTIGTLPKMLKEAFEYYGLKETPGAGNTPMIMRMAEALGIEKIYTGDTMAWCALFANFIIVEVGKPILKVGKDLYNFLRAKYLLNWGEEVKPGEEMLGDLLIFSRKGGEHVGWYIAESDTTFHVYGGNQSDQINFIEKNREDLIGARRFYATAAPASVKKYFINSSGRVSTNEA